MEESEDNMSSEDTRKVESPSTVKPKSKKRSLVERELETNLTARVTSPVTNGDGTSLSRYGRARRLKNELESSDPKKLALEVPKPLFTEKSPSKALSPVYKMHASNSPCKSESQKSAIPEEIKLESQIESIYQENNSLSRFGSEDVITSSPAKKFPKVYIRKDLIQRREPEETIMMIKHIFSPVKSGCSKKANSHLNNMEQSPDTDLGSSTPQNGYLDNSSVVKALDFDGNKKKKKENKDIKNVLSKNELFELEAKCPYQIGDLAWARMGSYPFWPCIITRDPITGLFLKKKMFGRVEHDLLHVTFFGDNGRRSWIVDNMLRKFLGQLEFETTREAFTPEDKKKDPKLCAAFFISEKRLPFWNISVEEAETLLREPKRLRIDILNEMLGKTVKTPKQLKSGKVTRTDSDVSLSESLYDSLFSEDDGKVEEADRSRNKSKNKSLDVSQVVTACLDNMAAKTGITMIQRQSHMDRWLQKAKSKTPEKTNKNAGSQKDNKSSGKKKKKTSTKDPVDNAGSLSSLNESNTNLLSCQNEHDYSKYENEENNLAVTNEIDVTIDDSDRYDSSMSYDTGSGIGIIAKVESLYGQNEDENAQNGRKQSTTTVVNDDLMLPEKDSEETENPTTKIHDDEQDSSHEMEVDSHKSINTKAIELNNENVELNVDNVGTNSNNVLQIENINDQDTIADDVDSNQPTDQDNGDSVLENVPNLNHKTEIVKCVDKCGDTDVLSVCDRLNKDVITVEDTILDRKEADIHTAGPNDMSIDDSHDNISKVVLSPQANDTVHEVDHTVDENIMSERENSSHSEEDCQINEYNRLQEAKARATTIVVGKGDLNVIENKTDTGAAQDYEHMNENEYADDLDYESDESSYKLEYSPLTNDEKSDNEDDDSSKIIKSHYEPKSNVADVHVGPIKINDTPESPTITSDSTKIQDKKQNENVSDVIKENGIHNDAESENEVNEETASIASEDSQPKTRSRVRNEMFLGKSKVEKTKLDPEFQKYVELHQDAVMDDFPELSKEEIDSYLFKTWLYEESKKSDVKKADDIHQSGIVKGLEKKVSLSLKRNNKKKSDTSFIDDTDAASINSEDSETSLAIRKTRFRRIKSPLEICNDNRSVDPSPDRKSKDDIDSLSINSDASELSHEQKSYKRIKTPFEVAQGKKVAEILLENITNHCEFELASLNSEDDEPLAKHINTTVKPPIVVENKQHEGKKIEADPTLPSKDMSNMEVKNHDTKDPTELTETESIDSEDSEVPLSRRKLRRKPKENGFHEKSPKIKLKDEFESETASINSENCDLSLNKRKHRAKNDKKLETVLEDPEFVQYLELRQDSLIDENPQLTQNEIVNYLYKTWLYEVNSIHELKKTDDIEQTGLVKGLNQEVQPKKVKKRVKGEKGTLDDFITREKPKRKIIQPYYNEDLSDMDIEDDIKVFEIFKNKSKVPKQVQSSAEANDGDVIKDDVNKETADLITQETKEEEFDEVELYFEELTQPKPNVFKGLVREKVCEICETPGNLVKCKSCNSMFHVDCVKNKVEVVDVPAPMRGRKKKKKPGRKAKSLEDSESQSDDKSRDLSEENNESIEEIPEPEICTYDAESFETQLEVKMKEILGDINTVHYDSYSSDDGLDWTDIVPGKCEIVDVKPKRKPDLSEYSDFKCNNCTKYDTPVCFVCKSAVSKSSVELRQRCNVAHCHKYYHLECLDQWPQTQFNGGEPSKNNKKINEFFEALSCPRHVCHTCVSDDPRGCKTRFSGDKLARCVKCPATYHAFTKCLPAGSQILTGSHIICPRHYEHRPGKVPCHVNTGWCFICALGGTLICCEYCPTSFHAECLNIKPPEGGYMCEDCETGRLPLYGEMVWVKLGHYRWWPGIILHPCEIPDNIMAVKHSPGEFVVRFFGQYDHYWVNRGRVFPFQEGDSGRISSQKSKIDAAFTTAMEHAQRACEILKCAQPNPEECLDIASSLLPPHYVKLRANRPCGLVARRPDDPEGSLTQCECSARDEDPCGPYSHCLNRMLLTECGPTCRAGERCNNRAFEKRLYPKLAPYRTPHRGWGLKTLEPIKAGQFVIEYVGELIDEEEFRRRMNRKHEIRDENFYFLTLDKERMIDAGPKGNLARFMNHCCEPNCETQKWTVLGDVRVGLFALKDIPANSEVTFNYNLECAGIEKKRCLCGASRCSGYIGAKPKQDESQSKKGKPAKRAYKKRKQESPTPKTKPTKRLGRPPKPRELTDIEKDLLIIRNATNGISSDDTRLSSTDSEQTKTLKRKRSFSQDETSEETSAKKSKCDSELNSS